METSNIAVEDINISSEITPINDARSFRPLSSGYLNTLKRKRIGWSRHVKKRQVMFGAVSLANT